MLFRLIRGVLLHQRSKMLLIAVTIALGASLATGMLNVVMGVEVGGERDVYFVEGRTYLNWGLKIQERRQ